MSRPLREGELIMLVDRKKRRYLTTLKAGGEFHSHAGALPQDEVIGQEEGQEFRSGKGAAYLIVRPTMSERGEITASARPIRSDSRSATVASASGTSSS